jgi:hypothetical protein
MFLVLQPSVSDPRNRAEMTRLKQWRKREGVWASVYHPDITGLPSMTTGVWGDFT